MTTGTKQRTVMPTADEVAALPTRARVAWVARSARRAVSTLKRLHGDAVADAIGKLDALTREVERFGGGGEPEQDLAVALDAAYTLCGDYGEHSAEPRTGRQNHALVRTADVSDIVAHALKAAREERPKESAKHACNAAWQAALVAGFDALGEENVSEHKEAFRLIRADFDKLAKTGRRLHWCDGTCVPSTWDGFDPIATDSTTAQDDCQAGTEEAPAGANEAARLDATT